MSEEPPENPFDELDDEELDDLDGENYFEEMAIETSDLDTESVWKTIIEGDPDASARDFGGDPDASASDSEDEQTGAVVPKSKYCKKCEHFSEPPDVACTNAGTEIVELVGVDSFRLRNCPVVASRQRTETVFPDES